MTPLSSQAKAGVEEWRVRGLEDEVRRLSRRLNDLESQSFSTKLTVNLHDDVLMFAWALIVILMIVVGITR